MKSLWTLTDPWTRRRAHRSLEIAARFPQAPTSHLRGGSATEEIGERNDVTASDRPPIMKPSAPGSSGTLPLLPLRRQK
jgi:hypothetical protein